MSFDAAYAALKAQHLGDRVRRFPGSSATVALAAQELGTAEGAIAKTMALLGPDGPILVLAAGDRKIDGGSFKRTFHFKPKFVPGTDVEALVGHAPGGVCPFGRHEGIPVWLDRSLLSHAEVWPACGDDASGVRLTPEELYRAAGAVGWCEVTKSALAKAA
ncbi:YbaK/EbsC family protein [Sutterella wadsworthensis]|uniref:YbaK/EbsC family protein n=2 Tax=Sutterella wadsworthensis TaxID=40545 RepID=UPI0013F6265D|nr:YbaK/EbsC family protein [Sutterella wadsworthensis]MBD8912033.1 YbaK/EbsC family protein [Sutterella wadsworthensis]